MPIRVCFVITRLVRGGAQKVVLDLVHGLDKAEYDLTLVHGAVDEADSFLPELQQEQVRLVEMPELQREPHLFKDLAALRRLYRFFRCERFDIVHTHTSKAGFTATLAARLAGIKRIVYTPHGHIFYRSGQIQGVSGSALRLAVFYLLRRLAESVCDVVVALTERDRREQIQLRLGRADQYVVINNGVELSPYLRCGIGADARSRQELGLEGAFPVLGTVGRLSTEKGQRVLIEALPLIVHKFPRARLLLVGEGPDRTELERLARSAGMEEHVLFTGFRHDVPAVLSALDIFVLPSFYEAQGLAVVEAMAAARPIVATAVGGVPGIITHGVEGLLVPPGDPKALALAVIRLVDDRALAQTLAENARRRAERDFDVRRMVAAYDSVYRRLAAPHARRAAGGVRLLALCPDSHFHAPIVLRQICLGLPQAEVTLMLTPRLGGCKGLLQSLRRSGVDFVFSMMFTQMLFEMLRTMESLRRVPFNRRQFVSMGDVAAHFSLRAAQFENINSEDAVAFARRVRPDFIVLVLFNQIVGRELASVARHGCLNIHTSLLPAYRGVAPNFWVLAKGDARSGVSIHNVTSEVDAGEVLAQEDVAVDPQDSFFSLYRRCAVVGARLLGGVICGRRHSAAVGSGGESSYFSFVTPEAVREFRRRGRHFFSFACLEANARLLRDPRWPDDVRGGMDNAAW
jgi:glycosyltransferase involved in cell wall biosynthesis